VIVVVHSEVLFAPSELGLKIVGEVRDRWWNFLVAGMLAGLALSAFAQHTTVEKNGVSGKIETDYNAAGKPVEMRTLGPDGKIQQKVDYEYPPGHYVAEQTDTAYWPNGQTRRVTHKSYDENANFIGEFIQTFDEAGKQIGGHRLTHDPWTGTYRCVEWNAAAQDYRAMACPAGEEEGGGGAQAPKKFTYDEVMKHLEAARKTAGREWEFARLRAASPMSSPTEVREVAVVLPAHVRPGDLVSGTVVENPEQYADTPEVTVTRVPLPFESAGDGSRLSGWLFETAGEEPRRADGPITLTVPQRGSELAVKFRQADNPAHAVSPTLNFARSLVEPQAEASSRPASFRVAALCMKGEMCAVTGPFSGDGKTFAAFDDSPATVIAETSRAAYIRIPEAIGPGSHPLYIAEGSKVIALPVVVGNFFVKNDGREMQAGQSLITFPTLEGPEDIADSAWERGDFSAEALERAQRLIAGFSPTEGKCAEREEAEDKGHDASADKDEDKDADEDRDKDKDKDKKNAEKTEGKIVLVVKNRAAGQISIHGAGSDTIYFCLGDEGFGRGPFKYDLRVDAVKDGKIDVRGYVIPLLGPVAGQEFAVKPEH
jgi:hypothetical protein